MEARKVREVVMIFKEKERYRIYNTLSENHGYFLTIIKIDCKIVYYLFDGIDEVKWFDISSNFVVDLIKII